MQRRCLFTVTAPLLARTHAAPPSSEPTLTSPDNPVSGTAAAAETAKDVGVGAAKLGGYVAWKATKGTVKLGLKTGAKAVQLGARAISNSLSGSDNDKKK